MGEEVDLLVQVLHGPALGEREDSGDGCWRCAECPIGGRMVQLMLLLLFAGALMVEREWNSVRRMVAAGFWMEWHCSGVPYLCYF